MHTVTKLRVAPVKGLGVVRRERVLLETQGVAEDRRLFLLRTDGSVVTQRRYPELTRVLPDLDLARGTLSVTFPDGTAATSHVNETGEELRATLFGKDRSGRLVPGPVAEALSDHVAEPLRLVLADSTGVGWDEGPVSILGRASADAVEVPDGHGASATERFRMLVEIAGTAPYAEDSWVGAQLRLGAAMVRVTQPLGRCVIINHSPDTGKKDWDGLRTLAALRGHERVTLGVIATVDRPGEVRVGDTVEVVRETRPEVG